MKIGKMFAVLLVVLALSQGWLATRLFLIYNVPPFRTPPDTVHTTVIVRGIAFREEQLLIPIVLLALGAVASLGVALPLLRRRANPE
jgi:hypothetical protein